MKKIQNEWSQLKYIRIKMQHCIATCSWSLYVSAHEMEKEMASKYSCLENHMDRGAWWPTVHRVTKSQTGLKQLHTHMKLLVYTGFGLIVLFFYGRIL